MTFLCFEALIFICFRAPEIEWDIVGKPFLHQIVSITILYYIIDLVLRFLHAGTKKITFLCFEALIIVCFRALELERDLVGAPFLHQIVSIGILHYINYLDLRFLHTEAKKLHFCDLRH